MRTAMVVLVLPAAEIGGELRGPPEGHAPVEFLLVGAMTAFHLAVHLWTTRGNSAVGDAQTGTVAGRRSTARGATPDSPRKVATTVVAMVHCELMATRPPTPQERAAESDKLGRPIASGSTHPPEAEPALPLHEEATALKLPTRVVEEYVRRGELRGERTQYGWRFTRQDLAAFWEPCPSGPSAPILPRNEWGIIGECRT
jgi:hypothetical protein